MFTKVKWYVYINIIAYAGFWNEHEANIMSEVLKWHEENKNFLYLQQCIKTLVCVNVEKLKKIKWTIVSTARPGLK